jgi:hypothetical protein
MAGKACHVFGYATQVGLTQALDLMKNNTASRIHRVMTTWKSVQSTDSAISGWLRVFNIKGTDTTRDYVLVNHRLHLLIDEAALLGDKLHLLSVSPGVYKPYLAKLDNALSPSIIHAKAQHVRQYLTEDVYTGLAFSSELLPEEEEGISADDFREIVDLVNQLELMLQDSSFPSSLVVLIRRHIRMAELAIAEYPIRGAVAIKDAVKFAVGDLAFEAGVLAPAGPQNADAVRRLWKKANDIADGAIKVDNLAQIGGRAMKLLSDLIGA